MDPIKTKKKRKKRELTKRKERVIKALEETKVQSAQSLLKDLTKAAPAAIHFKKALMDDPLAPTYLKLSNANDILDRTVPKPTQRIEMNSFNLNTSMTERELKELLARKIEQKAMSLLSGDDSDA